MLLDSIAVGISVTKTWSHAHTQKETMCEKEFADDLRFYLFFRAHPVPGDMAGSCDILLMFGKPMRQELLVSPLLCTFGYSWNRNCDWALHRLMKKVR